MRLYKYCDAGGIEILRSNSIKVSSPTEFNDPFDCNPIPDTTTPASREALKILIKGASVVWNCASNGVTPPGIPPGTDLNGVLQNLDQILERRINDDAEIHRTMMLSMERLAVLCLSEQRSHHLMWAHYADRHHGLVIEIETDGLFHVGKESTVPNHLFQVVYEIERPTFRYDAVLSPGAYTTKGIAWSYEEEWRVIFHQTQFVTRVIGGRELHLLPIPPECITGVLLGSRMPDSHRKEVKRLLADEKYGHIQLVQLEMDPESYMLREVPIFSV